MRVHLIDGTFELFRAFYGGPSAQSPAGSEVGATRALLGSLLVELRDFEATHVAVAFDRVIESFRNELFDGYKTGEGIEPALFAQFPLAERAAEALGFVVWPMVEFEADDAMATGAERFGSDSRVEEVVLCSPDKDFAQCVRGDRVTCFDVIRRRRLDEEGVVLKFGVPPASIPDYLALVGDTADGIPGLRGWGARSAAAVLARWRHLDAIPDDVSRWEVKVRGATRLADTLREGREEALLYRRLATLRTDVPLRETLEDLEWRGADERALKELCAELGDDAPLARVTRWRG